MLEANKIYLGDNLDLLKQLDDNSIHSCVSDFPYNLSFMGRKWDTIPNYQEWCYKRAKELLRVLKPGGYCLIFGGTRTHHRLVCAFEDAGFVIKDEIQWLYGQGFPKSYNISKGFDKKAGAEREVVGIKNRNYHTAYKTIDNKYQNGWGELKNMRYEEVTAPSTDLAKQWDGWGTALKPAHEPIMVAQKPIEKSYCYNVEKWGVGGLNINDSRIGFKNEENKSYINKFIEKNGKAYTYKDMTYGRSSYNESKTEQVVGINNTGRFPANVILDEVAGQILNEQSDILKGASRFFYCPKASKKDKTENGKIKNRHPTVKPTDLIKYLIRLVTPKDGICLDICLGSGTHIKACLELTSEGYPVSYIGFEKDKESFEISLNRERVVKENLKSDLF